MSKVRKLNIYNIKNRFLRGLVMWIALPVALIVLAAVIFISAVCEAGAAFGSVASQLARDVWRDFIKSNVPTLLFRRAAP